MSDISAFHFPYQGISVPNPTPFFPAVKEKKGIKTVKFNQGYVIDLTPKIPSIIQVTKCDGDSNSNGWGASDKFYVKVVFKTKAEIEANTNDLRVIKSAEIAKIPDGQGENLPATDKIFLICEFDSSQNISKIVLRENIIIGGKTFWTLNEKGESELFSFSSFALPSA